MATSLESVLLDREEKEKEVVPTFGRSSSSRNSNSDSSSNSNSSKPGGRGYDGYQLFRFTPSKALTKLNVHVSPSRQAPSLTFVADQTIVIVKRKQHGTSWRLISVNHHCGWVDVPSGQFSDHFKRIHQVHRYELLPQKLKRIAWFNGRFMIGSDLGMFLTTTILTVVIGVLFIIFAWNSNSAADNSNNERPTDIRLFCIFPFAIFLIVSLVSLWLTFMTDPGMIPQNPPLYMNSLVNTGENCKPVSNISATRQSDNSNDSNSAYNISNNNDVENGSGNIIFISYPANVNISSFGLNQGYNNTTTTAAVASGKNVKFCEYCKIYKPPNSKHCHKCECCILNYDHHCPWTGTCIGSRNYLYFFIFVLSMNILLIIGFVASVFVLIETAKVNQRFIYLLKNAPFFIFMAIWTSFCLLSLMPLLIYHIYLFYLGKTTYEHIRSKYHFDEAVQYVDSASCMSVCCKRVDSKCFNNLPSLLFTSTLGPSYRKLSDALGAEEYFKYYDIDEVEESTTPVSSDNAGSSRVSSVNAIDDVEESSSGGSGGGGSCGEESPVGPLAALILDDDNSSSNNNNNNNNNNSAISNIQDDNLDGTNTNPIYQLSVVSSLPKERFIHSI